MYITENHIFMLIIVFRGFDSYENDTNIANLFSCDEQVGLEGGGGSKTLEKLK